MNLQARAANARRRTKAASPVSAGAELRWSNTATWGGSLPTSGSAVVIAAGTTVILDVANAVAASVDIQGLLVADNAVDVGLTTGTINIGGAGELRIGTAAIPYARNALIELNGAEASRTARTIEGYSLGFTNEGSGRGIIKQPGGKITMFGTPPSVLRTRLNAHAAASATSLTLADSVDWLPTDPIVIGPTDFYGTTSGVTEKRVVNTAAGTALTITAGLSAARWGRMQYVTNAGMSLTNDGLTGAPTGAPTTVDERAHVGNLRRNIVIQGANDSAWTTSRFGVHLMFMGNTGVQMDGVRLYRCGQAGANARYPIHPHGMSFALPDGPTMPSNGTYLGPAVDCFVRRCVIEESSQRMVAIHMTDGFVFNDNIGYDITGHAIFFEDGSEQYNEVRRNLVLKVRAPLTANRLLLHDSPPSGLEYGVLRPQAGTSGLWLSNPQNYIEANSVGDIEGAGIWRTFSSACVGLSVNIARVPTNLPFLQDENNEAACCLGVGAMTAHPVNTPNNVISLAGLTYEATIYQGGTLENPIKGQKTWKNMGGGYFNRVLLVRYEGFSGADNRQQDVFGAAQVATSVADGILSVATSLNNATDYSASSYRAGFASYHETLNFQNALMVNFPAIEGGTVDPRFGLMGGGFFRLDDLYTRPQYTFELETNFRLVNCQAPYKTPSPNIDGRSLNDGTGKLRNFALGIIRDVNGLFVPAGNSWVPNNAFYTHGVVSSTAVNGSFDNGVHVPDRYAGLLAFAHRDDLGQYATFRMPIRVERQNVLGTQVGEWLIGDGAESIATSFGNMRHAALMNGGRYVLSFPNSTVNYGGTTVHLSDTYVSFLIDGQTLSTDTALLGVAFANGTPAKVIARPQQWQSLGAGNIPNDAGATVFTAAANFAAVVADTTGRVYWQDTTNNIVWLNAKTYQFHNGFDYGGGSQGEDARYRPVAICVKAASAP